MSMMPIKGIRCNTKTSIRVHHLVLAFMPTAAVGYSLVVKQGPRANHHRAAIGGVEPSKGGKIIEEGSNLYKDRPRQIGQLTHRHISS